MIRFEHSLQIAPIRASTARNCDFRIGFSITSIDSLPPLDSTTHCEGSSLRRSSCSAQSCINSSENLTTSNSQFAPALSNSVSVFVMFIGFNLPSTSSDKSSPHVRCTACCDRCPRGCTLSAAGLYRLSATRRTGVPWDRRSGRRGRW